jgi:hypothetical protein
MRKNYKLILALIIGILLGVCLNIVIKKYSTLYIQNDVSFEINPLEIFSIIINIFLAIYITRNLSKQNDLEKSEKELIINYLKDFQSEYNLKVNKLLECDDFESPNTNACFKILRTKISSILSIAEDNKLIEKNDATTTLIKEKVTDVWELFTGTPKTANSKANQATKEGIALLRLEKIGKIECASIELDKQIFDLTMKINRK